METWMVITIIACTDLVIFWVGIEIGGAISDSAWRKYNNERILNANNQDA